MPRKLLAFNTALLNLTILSGCYFYYAIGSSDYGPIGIGIGAALLSIVYYIVLDEATPYLLDRGTIDDIPSDGGVCSCVVLAIFFTAAAATIAYFATVKLLIVIPMVFLFSVYLRFRREAKDYLEQITNYEKEHPNV